MHPALTRIDHRPWEMPTKPWAGRQSWCDLLFAHWPISVDLLRPLVPEELTIQEFDSTSWIGLVPFRMQGVMLRPLPDLPWISAFPECNVRVYVEYKGKPGVWFLSLDATNSLAVWGARKFFHLPYHKANMSLKKEDAVINYQSCRASDGTKLDLKYKPLSAPYEAHKGTLEHWLTERYCLYAKAPDGKIYITEVHHHPWPLQRAEAEWSQNELFKPLGLSIEEPPAYLHFSKQIDVIGWWPKEVSV